MWVEGERKFCVVSEEKYVVNFFNKNIIGICFFMIVLVIEILKYGRGFI